MRSLLILFYFVPLITGLQGTGCSKGPVKAAGGPHAEPVVAPQPDASGTENASESTNPRSPRPITSTQPTSSNGSTASAVISVTNLPSGERVYIIGKRDLVLLEERPDGFTLFWAADILKRHPAITKKLQDSRQVANVSTLTDQDAEAIVTLVATEPLLKGFTPAPLGCDVLFYTRFVIVRIGGTISADPASEYPKDHYNIYLIRIPGGEWIFLERQRA
jgi:hypothetical protein